MSKSLTLMPFAQLPGEVLMDDRLKPTHIRVLIALYMHKSKKREEVWPKRKTLALLTGIHEATISRLTTELEQWGWVTKMGNSGGYGRPAAYRVHVPDNLTSAFDTLVSDDGDILLPQTLAKSATVAESTTVADLEQNPSGIDYLTLAKSARGKEHTKNIPEHTNISISACEPASVKKTEGAKRGQKKSASEDFSGAIDGVPDALLADWLEVRKAKRAGPLTATAIAGLLREAAAAGLTPAQAVAHCCECGWAGFRADWLANRQRPADGKSAGHAVDHQTPIETYAQRAARQRMEEVAPMAARKAPGQRCGFAAAQAFMAGDVIDVTPANLRLQG